MSGPMVAALAAKARRPVGRTILLAVLGGAYIALGGAFMVVLREQGMPPVVCGMGFSLGLFAVVATGSELLTGDALMVSAWLSGDVTLLDVFSTWGLVLMGNMLGSVVVGEAVAATGSMSATAMVECKCAMPSAQLFMRGIFCNVLVCMAVRLASGAKTTQGKLAAVLLPVTAFVTCGFEHSVANMSLLPMGAVCGADVTLVDCVRVVAVSMLGNMLGGTIYAAVLCAAHGRR